MSPHRKSHNLLYNLLKEKNKPPQEMVNKRGVPFGPTWLTRTLGFSLHFCITIRSRLYHKNGRNVPGTVSNLTGKISSVLSKRGRFLSSAISKKLNVFHYRWPKFSTNRFWFSVSVLCFYIRWSKWGDLL